MPAEGEPYRNLVGIVIDDPDHMRTLFRAARAGTPPRSADMVDIQVEQKHFRLFRFGERYAKYRVETAAKRVPVKRDSLQLPLQLLHHIHFQSLDIYAVRLVSGRSQLKRPGKTHDPTYIFGTGPHIPLLCASMNKRMDPDILIDIQKPHSLGSVKFVAGACNEVNRRVTQI